LLTLKLLAAVREKRVGRDERPEGVKKSIHSFSLLRGRWRPSRGKREETLKGETEVGTFSLKKGERYVKKTHSSGDGGRVSDHKKKKTVPEKFREKDPSSSKEKSEEVEARPCTERKARLRARQKTAFALYRKKGKKVFEPGKEVIGETD